MAPEQIVTTAGATEAIDLVARRFLAPGDLVFVEDPAWFVMFARFAAFGARIVGVPRGSTAPIIAALESLLARETAQAVHPEFRGCTTPPARA